MTYLMLNSLKNKINNSWLVVIVVAAIAVALAAVSGPLPLEEALAKPMEECKLNC
jgi:hypothetical protein